MSGKNAMVVGYSGLIGNHLVEELLQSNQFDKIWLIGRRKPDNPVWQNHPSIVPVVCDLGDLGSADLSRFQLDGVKIDSAFCCLGTTMKTAGSREAFRKVDYDYVIKFGELAQKTNAKHFLVVSSIGADAKSLSFYLRVKGEMEAVLAQMPFEYLHIFRPSMLLGDRREHRTGEVIGGKVMSAFGFMMSGPLKHYRPIHARDVAQAMVKKSQELNLGTHIHLSGSI